MFDSIRSHVDIQQQLLKICVPGWISGNSAARWDLVEGAMGVNSGTSTEPQVMSATMGRSGKTLGRLNSGTAPNTGL